MSHSKKPLPGHLPSEQYVNTTLNYEPWTSRWVAWSQISPLDTTNPTSIFREGGILEETGSLPDHRKLALPPTSSCPRRRKRAPLSGEALERRRQQNRANQLAFRQRKEAEINQLRQELDDVKSKLKAILDRVGVGDLKTDLEAVLATIALIVSLDPATGDKRHTGDSRATSSSPELNIGRTNAPNLEQVELYFMDEGWGDEKQLLGLYV